ncbi:Retrovirus-related Pol polyprotein from transposon 17.6 [Mytilus coruscus]|uniref:Retrovirus-related Pol polyprotein from transposon 17.6 n=1 Tax=Mytilus coruscus TaxID=42192 RepID=A0A6J8A5B0_MYTCO|nr:Retrovirus-related Pol polyprotein from transposon 17.6 [Mytilus coruscus]
MPVTIDNIEIAALIDSGSSINVISQQLFNSLPEHYRNSFKSANEKILLANNASINIVGTARIKIKVPTGKHWLHVYILSQTSNPLILGLTFKVCLCYLDDILIASETFDQHIDDLNTVFGRLKEAGLKLGPMKCSFAQQSCVFLGHLISSKGIQPPPERLQAIKDYPSPKSVKELRRVVGLLNWFRKYIPNFSSEIEPMTKLLRKNMKFRCSAEQENAFQKLKKLLLNSPVLAFPNYNIPFHLAVDTSSKGIGYVLYQIYTDEHEEDMIRVVDTNFHHLKIRILVKNDQINNIRVDQNLTSNFNLLNPDHQHKPDLQTTAEYDADTEDDVPGKQNKLKRKIVSKRKLLSIPNLRINPSENNPVSVNNTDIESVSDNDMKQNIEIQNPTNTVDTDISVPSTDRSSDDQSTF